MLPPVKGPSAKTPTMMARPMASGAAFLAAEERVTVREIKEERTCRRQDPVPPFPIDGVSVPTHFSAPNAAAICCSHLPPFSLLFTGSLVHIHTQLRACFAPSPHRLS